MTAFARTQEQGAWGSAVCEIRSINHRYLEMNVRLPEILHELEPIIRERIRQELKRGKVEFQLRYFPNNEIGSEILINQHLAEKLCQASEKIAEFLKNPAPIDTVSILQWPGILQLSEPDLDSIKKEILNLLEKGLKELIASRNREGEELKQLFLHRLEGMKLEVSKVRQHLPSILVAQRERLLKRFKDAELEMDSGRLEQEMVLFAQRTDVAEELDRIDAHISEVRHVLKHGGLVGRRLDFLMQELNREANTLGAKSVDVDTTRASVELKVLIEQVREQVQNIE